jgi:hypothetical protein
MWTPDYQETLAYFDQREQDIERIVTHLPHSLSLKEYKCIVSKFAREKRQIAARRRMIQAIVRASS